MSRRRSATRRFAACSRIRSTAIVPAFRLEARARRSFMRVKGISRREYLKMLGAGGTAATMASVSGGCNRERPPQSNARAPETPAESAEVRADRERRMKWWHAAKFGMFIHWGLYSVYGHHEWAMEEEGIPVAEYEQLAKQFKPQPHAARAWAKLAKQAGQKYMVMTSKHHEGFCNFDTKL